MEKAQTPDPEFKSLPSNLAKKLEIEDLTQDLLQQRETKLFEMIRQTWEDASMQVRVSARDRASSGWHGQLSWQLQSMMNCLPGTVV